MWASPADLAGDVAAGVTSQAVAEVASSVDLAGVASPAVLAEAASSADFAGFVDPCGTFGVEYVDSVLATGDCHGICGDFAEVASLAEHAGGALAMQPAVDVGRLISIGGPWGAVYDDCLPGFTV